MKANLYMLWWMQNRKRYSHAILSSWKEMLSTETMMNPQSSNSNQESVHIEEVAGTEAEAEEKTKR